MAFSLPATLVRTTSVLFAISASAVVLSTFLPSAVFSSTPVSSMNAPRVPEPSSREMTVIAPETPLSAPSAACVSEADAELPQPARAPVSMSAARSRDTLFFMIVFSFVIRSFFQYGNSLQKLCKIQKRSFVKHM